MSCRRAKRVTIVGGSRRRTSVATTMPIESRRTRTHTHVHTGRGGTRSSHEARRKRCQWPCPPRAQGQSSRAISPLCAVLFAARHTSPPATPAELHLLVSLSLFLFSTSFIVVSFVVCRSSIYRHYRENSTSRIMNNIATRCYARPKTNVRAPRESLPRTGFFPFLSFLFPSFPLLFFSFSSFIPSSLPSYLPCFLLSTM